MDLKTLRVLLLVALPVMTSGCVTAIRPYATDQPATSRSSRLSSLTVSVAGANERDIELAVSTLRRAGVFGAVVKGQGEQSDLSVNVMSSRSSIRCGTPQMATVLSLGLVPTGNVHHARLALEFSGAGAEQSLVIEREVYAQTKHGLWALFLRAKKEWTRPDWESDPAGLAIALREDIQANEEELVRLAGRRAT